MKLRPGFTALDDLRTRMGAPLTAWSIGGVLLDPREQILVELGGGIEIPLEELVPGPFGLLTYKGEQVLLYIKDTRKPRSVLEHDPENAPRFHIADCRTLDRMRAVNRFERYVVTNRTDGSFTVDWTDPVTREHGETEAALRVCKNCLSTLDWKGYGTAPAGRSRGTRPGREEIWERFSIPDFLFEYATFFTSKPGRTDKTAPPEAYPANWSEISARVRERARWICESCGANLSDRRGLLHCHHRNGVRSDCSPANLQALCMLCHSEQPNHQHMKVRSTDAEQIRRRRPKP